MAAPALLRALKILPRDIAEELVSSLLTRQATLAKLAKTNQQQIITLNADISTMKGVLRSHGLEDYLYCTGNRGTTKV